MSQVLEQYADIVELDKLSLHPENARKGNIDYIAQSLARFGQVRPLLVQQGSDVIVAGNHTFMAAQSLGWDKIAVIRVPLSDEDARAYLLTDNRLNDVASYDDEGLLAVLQTVQEQGGLDATGWNIDDIDDLIAVLDKVPTTEIQPFTGDYAESPEATAERWADRGEGAHREVVFLLAHDKFEQFKENVTVLKARYEVDTLAEAIYEAVAREAA